MRIGLDFDNTIVSYDALFHRVALENGHIPADLPVSKNAVRDHLRAQDKEHLWTEMQGHVYGARMQEAAMFPNAPEVIAQLRDAGHALFIISHKTRRPYLGPAYDLHGAAQEWIAAHLPLIPESSVFFHEKKEEKIGRIRSLACEAFLDDLPEILLHEAFPPQTKRYLFS
ncbi:MAG: haloacid dehalogenase-like hydrolase, partial [Pseudomonadota bacterium]|nr:haloacid dehalogenase-like hydrolase [Pseudomonadota bacterium]